MFISSANSSNIALGAGETFTGVAVYGVDYGSVLVSCKTDQDGMLYIEL